MDRANQALSPFLVLGSLRAVNPQFAEQGPTGAFAQQGQPSRVVRGQTELKSRRG